MTGGQWGKHSATRWLLGLLCTSLLLGLLSVVCTWAGLIGLKAQGQGSCEMAENKSYPSLGKWDDGPKAMHLNWHVCEIEDPKSKLDDLLDDGWHQTEDGNWYQAFCGWKRFEEANRSCANKGAHLASIRSEEENAFVQKLCGFETCWIGLHEQAGNEDWEWTTGEAVGDKEMWRAWTNWNDGEPNNAGGVDESVAFMNGWFRLDMPDPHDNAGDCGGGPRTVPLGSGRWHDVSKDARIQHTVCEKIRTTLCEAGWLPRDKHCYKMICAMYTFWEAADACKSFGAELVSINNAEENNFVRNMCGLNTCRIGLSEPSGSEVWQWPDGTFIGQKYEWSGYTNWDEGEPNNWGGHDEDSAVLNVNDIAGSMKKAFLFQRLRPLYVIWMLMQFCLPICLLVVTTTASRCNNACCAQVICMVTGVASIGLCIEILIWLLTVSKVDDNWPAGSQTLLVFLSFVGLVQIIICCVATSKAQELQWATTTVGWSAMGVREVAGPLNPSGTSLTDLSNPPGP